MGAHADVYAAISSCGIPVTHVAWPVGKSPALPWAVYMVETDPMGADDTNYAEFSRCTVELYMQTRDADLVRRVGEAIEGRIGPYTSYETWIETETCMMVAFRFTHHPKNGDNNG